jgi:hypothetical protein
VAMGEIHKGMSGTHQSAHKMRWMLRKVGVYWSNMLTDCFKYYKGCESSEKFGKVQTAPASILHPVVKLWPFRGWGLDFVGEVHPSSSKGHRLVLVATDYFTKWVEVVPLKNMTPGAHQFRVRAYSAHNWDTTDANDRPGGDFYVTIV